MHTCAAVIGLLARLRSGRTRRRLVASPGFPATAHGACHGVWLLQGRAAVEERLGVLWMLCGRVLPSGTAGPGPGHDGPLTVHMGIRSIAVSSSYRRVMHGRVQIAARQLQMGQQGIRRAQPQGSWQGVLQAGEGCSDIMLEPHPHAAKAKGIQQRKQAPMTNTFHS